MGSLIAELKRIAATNRVRALAGEAIANRETETIVTVKEIQPVAIDNQDSRAVQIILPPESIQITVRPVINIPPTVVNVPQPPPMAIEVNVPQQQLILPTVSAPEVHLSPVIHVDVTPKKRHVEFKHDVDGTPISAEITSRIEEPTRTRVTGRLPSQ